jgi:hypothetical protein
VRVESEVAAATASRAPGESSTPQTMGPDVIFLLRKHSLKASLSSRRCTMVESVHLSLPRTERTFEVELPYSTEPGIV